MVEEDQDIKLACVKLNGDQLTELATNINSRYDITGVTLRNCSLDDTNFPSFATSFLKTSSRLKVLDFSQNRLGPKSMAPLAATIQKNPGIDTLTLSGNPLGNDGCKTLVNAILNTKDPFPFLRQSSGYMTPAETITKADKGEKVDFSENNGSCLKNLDLGNTNASDAAVTEFSHLLKKNKTLRSLNLTGNTEITPTGWEMLGNALKDNKTLQTLNLEGTNMGDEGVAHLTKGLRVNAGLKTLVLENCGLTEAGGKWLIELVKNNTSITDLKLQEGNTISDDTRDEIQQFLALNKC